MHIHRSNRLVNCLFIGLITALVILSVRRRASESTWLTSHMRDSMGLGMGMGSGVTKPHTTKSSSIKPGHSGRRYAFATFLSAATPFDPEQVDPGRNATTEDDIDMDGYYLAVRNLLYSLMHHSSTRSARPVDVIVLCTSSVTSARRARLEADGAIVLVSEPIKLPEWITPGRDNWREVTTKLRLWTLTEYEKICFVEADHLIIEPIDGVFDDPATALMKTGTNMSEIKPDEPALPSEYIFASKSDVMSLWHTIPPEENGFANSGFFVFRPSLAMYKYYTGVLEIKDRFWAHYPEQGLFNYAHRKEGNMPWPLLNWRWNSNWPTMKDFEAGIMSLHDKYWKPQSTADPVLKMMWNRRMSDMRAFYKEKIEGGSV